MQLTLRSSIRAGAIIFGVAVLIWGIDRIPRVIPPYEPAIYFMVAYPPPTGSLIDVFADIFGPSPAYGIGLALLGIVLFTVLYAPFPVLRRARARKAPDAVVPS